MPQTAENPAPLARLSRAVLMLAEARTLKEVKHVKAMAEAAEQYARAEKLGQEAVEYALEVKFLAARKAGEILIAMEAAGERAGRGDRKSNVPAGNISTLPDLGVTRKEAMNWQSLARLDEKKFAAALPRLVKGESVAAVVPRRPPRPGWDAGSMRRRGAFRSLCRDLVALGTPAKIAKELKDFDDAEACLALADSALEWLRQLRKEW